ncbi:MAG: hypothetical protein AB1567_10440 [bacterium]
MMKIGISFIAVLFSILEIAHLYFGLGFYFTSRSFIRSIFLGSNLMGVIVQWAPIYSPILTSAVFISNCRKFNSLQGRISFILMLIAIICFIFYLIEVFRLSKVVD